MKNIPKSRGLGHCTKIASIIFCTFFIEFSALAQGSSPQAAPDLSQYAPLSFSPQQAPTAEKSPEVILDANCTIDKATFNLILAEVKKRKGGDLVNNLAECLKSNRKLMMRVSIIDATQFQYVADFLKEDDSFVYRIAEINPEVLKFIPEQLRLDPQFMESVTYLNRDALQYADPRLIDNKIFMRKMIQIDSRNYLFASNRLKEIPQLATIAFKDNGMLLAFAPDKIKDNKELVKIAVNSSNEALEFASDALKKDEAFKKIIIHKTSVKSPQDLAKFVRQNYLVDSNKKHLGLVIGNRMKFFEQDKIINRDYVTKWQRNFGEKNNDELRLIVAEARNYPVSWHDDFKRFPLLIEKIENFLLSHQVDQNTIDSLSTTYFWKVKKVPQTVVFNLYLLRNTKDIELGSKFGNVTSLTAIAQKQGEKWNLSVVEVIFDSEMEVDLTYENGHKKYILWDLYQIDKKDKNPKIIFKVEDRFRDYFQIFEEQSNGKYRMIQEIDALKDAAEEELRKSEIRPEDSKPEEF